MTRFVGPFLFLAASGWVFQHNREEHGSVLILPFLDVIPGYAGDLAAQGQLTWQILVGVGTVWLLWRFVGQLRESPSTEEEDE